MADKTRLVFGNEISHTGDVTGVTTLTVATEAVAYSKMQHVSANKVLGSVAGGDVSEIDCTAAGRALLDDAAVSDQRTTLGLGTAATTASGDYATAAQANANHTGDVTGATALTISDTAKTQAILLSQVFGE